MDVTDARKKKGRRKEERKKDVIIARVSDIKNVLSREGVHCTQSDLPIARKSIYCLRQEWFN